MNTQPRIATAIALLAVVGTSAQLANAQVAKEKPEAFAWSKTAGRPEIGMDPALYLWHEGDTVFFLSVDGGKRGQRIVGSFGVREGQISDARTIKAERRDGIRSPKPNVITFSLQTFENRDGVKFKLNGGTILAADLAGRGDRRPLYLGSERILAKHHRGTFDLSK